MDTEVTFSVVMPVFNRQSTVAQSLDSIANQTWPPAEVIVVDDGSTDGTCDIVERYDFVTLLRQQNAGPGSARNRGIEIAKGEYIAFLDSDDVWFPWTLQRYAEVIELNDRPAIVTGSQTLFTDATELAVVSESVLNVLAFPDYLSSGEQWLWHGVSSFVIRRDVLVEAGGFAEGRINGEDAELLMRLGTAGGFVHVASPLMFGYRTHPGNVTLDIDKSAQGAELLIEGERTNRFPGGSRRAAERRQIISRHVRPLSVSCAKRGYFGTAFTFYFGVLKDSLERLRFKYLFGLPLIAICGMLNRAFSTGPRAQ
nr:glycosyltransferase family A protein [Rubinisphaera sp. JC750]